MSAAAAAGPLRILMMIHTRWSRNLGAPRAQLEIGEELERLGCEVSKYSYEDAFPEPARPSAWRSTRIGAVWTGNQSFAKRAIAFVRANAARFDVIDANQTDLPVSKRRLGFGGLLVARSVGLIPEYEAFERWAAGRWPGETGAKQRLLGAMSYVARRRRSRHVMPSLHHADLVNVSSRDDLAIVRDRMGLGDKVVWFPLGMSRERLRALREAAHPPSARLAARTVAFIGTWNPRKGSRDWPEIFARLRQEHPEARLLLLGTSISEAGVRRAFPADVQAAITVVSAYESCNLPGLLAGATVGAFPGYLEGFGFSVLEKLAAGLPIVAYDAPGPRDMLEGLPQAACVPRGDTAAFAQALGRMLRLREEAYAALSEGSSRTAATFAWDGIARDTLATYRERLSWLKTR